jgi:hypothetical protein
MDTGLLQEGERENESRYAQHYMSADQGCESRSMREQHLERISKMLEHYDDTTK